MQVWGMVVTKVPEFVSIPVFIYFFLEEPFSIFIMWIFTLPVMGTFCTYLLNMDPIVIFTSSLNKIIEMARTLDNQT